MDKDRCLLCGWSTLIPEDETRDGFAHLFCMLIQKEVPKESLEEIHCERL